ncbi:hypothetical protein Tco_0728687 [Tanacetum coccineum]|uniref:Uncharacterized protein n=1 Tax=Tanacetum coccineum TaxID=301880 RepID=A0ABQ4YN03_9ASTR
MTTLKFVDTHNMVAFFAKPAESEGFEQIATVKAKTVNGELQLQALVDGKKIIITESIVRRNLQLEDTEGVDYLPNATIFEQLTLMSSKTTAWNVFSSTMDSAITCLATNQKFNFSKYIFESMVKNLDNVGKILMYLRVGKGFSGRVTPLFPTMVVHNQEEIDEAVNKEMNDSLVRAATTASSLEAEQESGNIDKTQSKATPNEPSSQELVQVVVPGAKKPWRIQLLRLGGGPRRQETMGDTIAHTRVKKLEQKKRSRTHGLKRLYKVGSSRRVESSDKEGLGEKDASKQGRIVNIGTNKDIYLVNVHTDEDMFGVNDLDGDEVIVDNVDVVKTVEETRSVVEEETVVVEKAKLVSAAEETVNVAATTVSTTSTIPVSAATTTTTTTVSDFEITLAQALTELKSAASTRPKVKVQYKGKGKMVEPEPVKKMSKKDLLRLDEELAFKLQAEEEEEEERLAREKA